MAGRYSISGLGSPLVVGVGAAVVALAAGAILTRVGAAAVAEDWDTREHALTVDGQERSYLVFAPRSDSLRRAAERSAAERSGAAQGVAAPGLPAMLVMHGGLGNAEGVDRLYGMNAVAEREGFIAVYPNGPRIGKVLLRQRRTWNAGACCGPAVANQVDDVAFLRAMIETLVTDYGVDRNRVYASGMSNGAMMTYRLLCEAPDLIAAAIPVAGTLVLDDCKGGADVPLLHIHGADDDNVPVAGGIGGRALADVDYRPLAETFALVAEKRNCAEPVTRTDEFGAGESVYACTGGAPIVVKILPGVGHTWPGADSRLLQRDPYNGEFSASEAAWAFARDYRK